MATSPRSPRALVTVAIAATLALALPPAAAQPTESDVFVAEGVLALEAKSYEEALGHFRRALRREPDHLEALYYSGVAHMALQQPQEALKFLARARRLAPGERSVAFQLGLAYFALEQYESAEPLLEQVFATDPGLDGLGYYVGFLRYRRQDLQGALRAFRAGRTRDPNVAQLTRFYSGLVLAALGLPAEATAAIEDAIRAAPSSPLTAPAERLRESLVVARTADRRFRASARLGGFFDDNVAAEPLRVGGDPTIGLLREGENETFGELFALRLEYDVYRQGPWEATAGYSFFTTYNNDLPAFNVIDHVATLRLSHRTAVDAMPVVSALQYSYDYLMLDEEEFVQRHGVSLWSTIVESADHLTSLQGRVEVKEFAGPVLVPEEAQDAVNWTVGAVHVLRFAHDRHFIKAGYHFDWEDAEGANYAYAGHRFVVGGQYTLPWREVRLSYDFTLHYRDYRNRHSFLPAPDSGQERSDQEYWHVARAEMPLGHGLTISVDYQGTFAYSNLDAFSYRRNVYTLSLSWQY